MLAMQSYEQANGFAVMDADELYYINAGSGVSGDLTVSGTVTTDSTGKTTAAGTVAVVFHFSSSSGSGGGK